MNPKSIYQLISESVTPEGRLPFDFSLPAEDAPVNQLRFAPGAKDGIGIYHTAGHDPKEAAKEVEALLRSAWAQEKKSLFAKLFPKNKNDDETEKIVALLHDCGTLSLVDTVLGAIRENHDNIVIDKMVAFACRLAFDSSDEEAVKFGIALLGLIDLTSLEGAINKLMTLGLYDELTLYVSVALSHCENGNALLFDLAQKISGWGKIHLVERLEPQSEEIKSWLLRSGCENSIMDSYLGLVCAEKGDLLSVLRRGEVDEDTFTGICVIIDALIAEGPVDGISVYEHAAEALLLYLQLAKSHAATIQNLLTVMNVRDWLEDCELSEKDALLDLCREIIARPDWVAKIESALRSPAEKQGFFSAASAARRLGLDVASQLFAAVKADPLEHFGYLSQLYPNPTYAEELTRLYEGILHLDEMEKGMGDALFASSHRKEHSCLDFVLQELKAYPNMGESLVRAALLSPIVRERHGASKALLAWSEHLGKPLAEIVPDLMPVVREVASSEINEEIKERLDRLLTPSLSQ